MIEKRDIDNWITNNYCTLRSDVQNILAPRNMLEYTDDLLSNAYFYLLEVTASTYSFLKSVFLNYCHKQAKWQGTDLKKEITGRETLYENVPFDIYDESSDELSPELFDYINQIGAIEIYRRNINTVEEKRMFEIYMKLHFKHGKVSKTILANHLQMPESSATILIKEFLEKIRRIYVENGGELGKLRGKSKYKN